VEIKSAICCLGARIPKSTRVSNVTLGLGGTEFCVSYPCLLSIFGFENKCKAALDLYKFSEMGKRELIQESGRGKITYH
jgi:hypothetical protein